MNSIESQMSRRCSMNQLLEWTNLIKLPKARKSPMKLLPVWTNLSKLKLLWVWILDGGIRSSCQSPDIVPWSYNQSGRICYKCKSIVRLSWNCYGTGLIWSSCQDAHTMKVRNTFSICFDNVRRTKYTSHRRSGYFDLKTEWYSGAKLEEFGNKVAETPFCSLQTSF